MIDEVLRTPPHSVVFEKSALSSMLQDPGEYIPRAIELGLLPEHFYQPACRTLCATFYELRQSGHPIEVGDLIQWMQDRGRLDGIGGPSALIDVYTYAPSPHRFEAHVRGIREKAVGRALIASAASIINSVYDSPGEIPDALAGAERAITAISESANDSTPSKTIREQVSEALDEFEARARGQSDSMGTPLVPEIDRLLMGAHPGRLMVICGFPEGGKSVLAMQMALGAAMGGEPILYLSLELSEKSAVDRALIQLARIDAATFSDPLGNNGAEKLDKSDLAAVKRAALSLAAAPLRIKRADNRKLATVVAEIRKARREMGIKVAVVDYAQKVQAPNTGNKVDEMEEVSHTLYELAGELGITIILPSQVNADGDTKGGRVFEEDADDVLLIVQDRNKESPTYKRHRHILVVKNRHNSQGGKVIPMILDRDKLRFVTGEDETESNNRKPKFQR